MAKTPGSLKVAHSLLLLPVTHNKQTLLLCMTQEMFLVYPGAAIQITVHVICVTAVLDACVSP